MGTSTSQLRAWWDYYECAIDRRHPERMTYLRFPRGGGAYYSAPVADESVPIFKAVIAIMESEPYYMVESASGTYNCRTIGSSGNLSLHSYGIALDLNPRANPQQSPVKYDYPASFIRRMETMTANGKQALQWGGRWSGSTTPDAMHWQVNVAPYDCKNIKYEGGTMATWKSADGWTYTDYDSWKNSEFVDAIKWNINEGLITGRKTDKEKKLAIFDPNTAVQRDELASALYRLGKDSPTLRKEIEAD